MRSRASPGLACLLFALASAACTTQRSLARHAASGPWRDGLAAQGRDPWQWGSEAALLVALPLTFVFDDELRDAALDHDAFQHDGRHVEDELADVLAYSPLALGLFEATRGDEGRAFEVAAESLVATLAATQALKYAFERERPDGGGESFPSGHTSRAFMGATFIARWVEERWDSHWGYAAWLPAAGVGLARVQHDKHWTSDVVAGALLGTFLTNLVWNAHYGPGDDALYAEPPKVAWRLAPLAYEGGLGLSLRASL